MSVNVKAFTITGIIIAALSYVVCATFVAIAPDAATTMGSYITHMNLREVGRSVTFTKALIGGTFFTVFVSLVCASSGFLYNRLAR